MNDENLAFARVLAAEEQERRERGLPPPPDISDSWRRTALGRALIDVLKKLDSLRAVNAQWREIGEELREVPSYSIHDNTDCFFHGDCYPELVNGSWKHHPDCTVTKARALLGESHD